MACCSINNSNMLAISKTSNAPSSVNILPCKINHDGPAKVTKRHWQPREDPDGSRTAYFRGRRLRARCVKLPEKYEGLVLRATGQKMIEPILPSEDEQEPELPDPTKIVEQVAKFDEVTVWGHDKIPAADDQLVKGIEEWISLAEAIHAP